MSARRPAILAVAALGILSTAWAVEDELKLVGQPPAKVSILKEKKDEIEYSDEGGTVVQAAKADRVEWVLFADAPLSYKRGMDAFAQGKYQLALEGFLEAQAGKASTKGDWMSAHLDFYVPVCIILQPEKMAKALPTAGDRLKEFMEKRKEHWLVYSAAYYYGKSLLLQKKLPEALKSFQDLKGASTVPGIQAKADAGVFLCLRAQGQADAALKQAKALVQAGQSDAEMLAAVADILLEEKKDFAEAEKWAADLVRIDDKSAQQKACEILGCVAFQKKAYRDALEDLLRAELLFTAKPVSSRRTALHIVLCLKALMEKSPEQFPAWEYEAIFKERSGRLDAEARKAVAEFKG